MSDEQNRDYSVTVFMSTYNGEKYVEEQIQSILNQTGVRITLLIRDDGSTDGTKEILKRLSDSNNNIEFCLGNNIGYGQSFLTAIYTMNYAVSDFYALSDQDDIWNDDKLISAIRMMNGIDGPALYYSAQRIADEKGKFIRNEKNFGKMLKYSVWSASKVNLMRGCTEVWNVHFHNILKGQRPNIEKIGSHDHYINMIAIYKAQILYDEKAHMDYRQTESNVVGTYRKSVLKPIYALKKARMMFIKQKLYKSNISREIEKAFPELRIATAHYRTSFSDRITVMFDSRYNEGISLKWRLFTMLQVLTNRL